MALVFIEGLWCFFFACFPGNITKGTIVRENGKGS